MADFEIENINPEDVYSDKELQNDFTKLSMNGETVAVIIPFHKSQTPQTDQKVVNISELIREEEHNNEVVPDDVDTENKERGDFRKRLLEKGHTVDVPDEGNQVYTNSAFEVTSIEKIASEDASEENLAVLEEIRDELNKFNTLITKVSLKDYIIKDGELTKSLDDFLDSLLEMNRVLDNSLKLF